MLEVLLVIIIAALLITISLRVYLSYQQTLAKRFVKQDLATIQSALNQYYQAIPCDKHGVWQGSLNINLLDQLTLTPLIEKRAPIVAHYKAFVRQSDQHTQHQQPVYLLEVRARVMPAYQHRIDWLQSYFNATNHTQQALVWRALPPLFKPDASKSLWVLDASRARFQQQQTKAASRLQYTHAYCAR